MGIEDFAKATITPDGQTAEVNPCFLELLRQQGETSSVNAGIAGLYVTGLLGLMSPADTISFLIQYGGLTFEAAVQ